MAEHQVGRGWKDLVSGIAYRCGVIGAWRDVGIVSGLLRGERRATPVFVVHRIGEDDPFFPAMSLEAFEALVRVVARHYQVLPFVELARRIRTGICGPLDTAITFDDGYAETHRLAEPVLRRHGAVATTFVVTAGFEGERLWFDELAQALRAATAGAVQIPGGETLPLGPYG